MLPAFRCFGCSKVMLAKSGNNMLKHCPQLWLLETAQDDTSTMFTQINEFNSFLAQVTSSSSKGPCSLTHDRPNRSTQICTAKAYVAEFNNKNACCEAIEENTNPWVFVPSNDARDRPVKTMTGKEGRFLQKKKTEESNCK